MNRYENSSGSCPSDIDRDAGSPLVLNLVHDAPRQWSDVVKCLNQFGCPVQLIPTSEWLKTVFADRDICGARLYGYRRLFCGANRGGAHLRPFETYLECQQQRVSSQFSLSLLDQIGLSIPPMDTALVSRYLEHYRRSGLLPERDVAVSA